MARKKLDFEAAMERIEKIVTRLEEEEVSLEESIALYREGMELSALCKTKLLDAEKQVLQLNQNHNGSFTETPFLSEEAQNEL